MPIIPDANSDFMPGVYERLGPLGREAGMQLIGETHHEFKPLVDTTTLQAIIEQTHIQRKVGALAAFVAAPGSALTRGRR